MSSPYYLSHCPGRRVLITDEQSPDVGKTGTVDFPQDDVIYVILDGEIDPSEFTVYQLSIIE